MKIAYIIRSLFKSRGMERNITRKVNWLVEILSPCMLRTSLSDLVYLCI